MASSFQRGRPASGPVVQGFAGGGFSVDGQVYPAVLLTPEAAAPWSPPPLAELDLSYLQPLLELSPTPEFILFGSGSSMAFPPRALIRDLESRGIGLEAMDSRAAARTWGLLRAEGRWIAAAIMGL